MNQINLKGFCASLVKGMSLIDKGTAILEGLAPDWATLKEQDKGAAKEVRGLIARQACLYVNARMGSAKASEGKSNNAGFVFDGKNAGAAKLRYEYVLRVLSGTVGVSNSADPLAALAAKLAKLSKGDRAKVEKLEAKIRAAA
jgi:hypothetical protein